MNFDQVVIFMREFSRVWETVQVEVKVPYY